MNEGKPTEGPSGRADGDDPGVTTGHPAEDEAAGGSPVEGHPAEGSPAGRTGGEPQNVSARGATPEDDHRPARPTGGAEETVAGRHGPLLDGPLPDGPRPAGDREEALADRHSPFPDGGVTPGHRPPAHPAAAEQPHPPVVDHAVSPPEPADPAPRPPVVTDRPGPLHDPDPYSTPPYGEPGPWAPAPPVQHPAATPAPGPAVPAAPAPIPAVPGGPAPGGLHPSSPAVVPGGPVAPGADTGVPTPVPGPDTSRPVPGAPVPAPEAHSGPVPPAAAPADPWRRYDPWAGGPVAAGPLQQTGAAVAGLEQLRRRRRRGLIGGALLLALVSGGVGGGVGAYLERNGGMGVVELPQAPVEAGDRDADGVAGIAARALPGVVTLHVSGSGASGTGTGFVLDTRGHILTNSHVVDPAGSGGGITVVFNGGQTAEAEVVGKDSGYDLAVVRVTGVRGLRPLPLGNSDSVRVGDPVVAIGAPFDLEGTVTAGIISARERPITAGGGNGDASDVSYVDALQTDAPINPGNSGGPLLDTQGRVIGINSAIRSAADGAGSDGAQAGSIGLGFAIPVNQGKRVAEELINTGRATHPVIGVTLDMDYPGDGARVGTEDSGGSDPVTDGGPGDRAGIRPGDVITAVDGRRVHSGEELIVKTRAHRPGDRLELTVERDGEERALSLVLGSSGSG
ncbi:trypsin-like peptidase domain-containing protein [Streptomyces sp. NPDC003401]